MKCRVKYEALGHRDKGWLLSLSPGLRVFIQIYILQVRPPDLSLNREIWLSLPAQSVFRYL